MSFFNLQKQCPGHMVVTSQAGIIIHEYHCMLQKDHHGPHRSKDGAIWAPQPEKMNNVRITDL